LFSVRSLDDVHQSELDQEAQRFGGAARLPAQPLAPSYCRRYIQVVSLARQTSDVMPISLGFLCASAPSRRERRLWLEETDRHSLSAPKVTCHRKKIPCGNRHNFLPFQRPAQGIHSKCLNHNRKGTPESPRSGVIRKDSLQTSLRAGKSASGPYSAASCAPGAGS
jgi:hypothetical protein